MQVAVFGKIPISDNCNNALQGCVLHWAYWYVAAAPPLEQLA
jgi:hypothetical protein